MGAANEVLLEFAGDLASLVRRPGGVAVRYALERRASVKDALEALGVPHTEVYGLFVDGAAVDFGHLLEPGQRVRVEPAAPPVDVAAPTLLRPRALPGLRFLVDENVAKLAPLLRALGFDAARDRRAGDARIARQAAAEGRVVLSRDRALLKRSAIAWGRLVRAAMPLEQLAEVLGLFGVREAPAPFSRCLRCNLELAAVAKRDVLPRLEPKTRLYYDEFSICPGCGRIYWRGSHQEHMRAALRGAGVVLPG
ncbi:Mut7-C ubiquitin/RNAse domain-containing protein [Desulfovibrio aminophilus]|nr:Mut7-C ubiquitin/RNAse domain-containing protein [Desulfovibrio aminophilus]MCM0756872.1 Mut7-C ubiquitin/RNAse domain-containing protein [Desulfovibrio aminophilus]